LQENYSNHLISITLQSCGPIEGKEMLKVERPFDNFKRHLASEARARNETFRPRHFRNILKKTFRQRHLEKKLDWSVSRIYEDNPQEPSCRHLVEMSWNPNPVLSSKV
jgi:hypothetical protein